MLAELYFLETFLNHKVIQQWLPSVVQVQISASTFLFKQRHSRSDMLYIILLYVQFLSE